LFTSSFESEYIQNSIYHWKVVYIFVEYVIKDDSIYKSKSFLHRG
jgi:hypothetical protein